MAKKKQAQQAQAAEHGLSMPLHTDNRYVIHGKTIGDPVSRKIGKYHAIAKQYASQAWSVSQWIENGPSTVTIGSKTITVSRNDRAGSLGKRAQNGVIEIVVNNKPVRIEKTNRASNHAANISLAMELLAKYPQATIRYHADREPWRSA